MIETVFAVTALFLVGLFFLLISYDIYSVMKGKPTISWAVFCVSRRFPIVAFLMGFLIGVLAGHFFFPIPVPIGQ